MKVVDTGEMYLLQFSDNEIVKVPEGLPIFWDPEQKFTPGKPAGCYTMRRNPYLLDRLKSALTLPLRRRLTVPRTTVPRRREGIHLSQTEKAQLVKLSREDGYSISRLAEMFGTDPGFVGKHLREALQRGSIARSRGRRAS